MNESPDLFSVILILLPFVTVLIGLLFVLVCLILWPERATNIINDEWGSMGPDCNIVPEGVWLKNLTVEVRCAEQA
jgi:hypothetical protein